MDGMGKMLHYCINCVVDRGNVKAVMEREVNKSLLRSDRV